MKCTLNACFNNVTSSKRHDMAAVLKVIETCDKISSFLPKSVCNAIENIINMRTEVVVYLSRSNSSVLNKLKHIIIASMTSKRVP